MDLYLCGVQRWWAFILIMIVAIAAFTPCCTIDDCQGDTIAKQESSKPSAEGGCSPFFSCASCPGFTTTAKTITVPAPADCLLQYFETYINYHSSSYTASPWQPPRTVWFPFQLFSVSIRSQRAVDSFYCQPSINNWIRTAFKNGITNVPTVLI